MVGGCFCCSTPPAAVSRRSSSLETQRHFRNNYCYGYFIYHTHGGGKVWSGVQSASIFNKQIIIITGEAVYDQGSRAAYKSSSLLLLLSGRGGRDSVLPPGCCSYHTEIRCLLHCQMIHWAKVLLFITLVIWLSHWSLITHTHTHTIRMITAGTIPVECQKNPPV